MLRLRSIRRPGTGAPGISRLIGCAYGRTRSYVLGIPPVGGPTGSVAALMFTLAGSVVAFEKVDDTELHPGSREEDELVVRDLRGGKTLHRLPTGTSTTPPEHGDVGIGGATAIVLKSDGAVAWIVAVRGTNTEYQIHVADATGSQWSLPALKSPPPRWRLRAARCTGASRGRRCPPRFNEVTTLKCVCTARCVPAGNVLPHKPALAPCPRPPREPVAGPYRARHVRLRHKHRDESRHDDADPSGSSCACVPCRRVLSAEQGSAISGGRASVP